MEATKKEKVVNFGLTENMMNFMNGIVEKANKPVENLTEKEKIADDAKKEISEIIKREVKKVGDELNKETDINKRLSLISQLDKLSDVIRFW